MAGDLDLRGHPSRPDARRSAADAARGRQLTGQWLYGGDGIFGSAETRDDDEEVPFPAADFTIHRLPRSGLVLAIDLEGPRLVPEAVIAQKTKLPSWAVPSGLGDSLLLTGDFDELVRAGTAPAG